MLNLKTKNPAAHIGGLLWLQGSLKGYSFQSIVGLMKISNFELGTNSEGQPTNNTTYSKGNNAFGMGCVKKRPTTQIGTMTLSNGECAGTYKSVWASVDDVFKWCEYNKIPADVKKSDDPNAIITFAESKKWMTDMTNYKKSSTEKAEDFVKEGRKQLLIRVGVFSIAAMFLLGIFLKKNSRAKFNAYRKKLGIIGTTLFGKAKRVVRRRKSSTKSRTATIRRTYARRRKK